MRQSFCGYYAPDDTEIKQMLSEGIWVFDTNVLLDLFRLSENNANRVLEVFEKEKEHLWLPYQIAKEYHENLVTVIKKQHEECRKMIKALSDFSDKFQIRRNQSFLDETMKCEAERFSVQMKNALEQKQLSLKDLIHNNPVKSRISDIFEKRVGGKPTPENELEYKAIAKGRYSQKVPPGYEDASKSDDKKYGDYFLWRQIMDYAGKNQKDIIFITGDTKEDWFAKEFGETIGPRPELIEEFNRETGKKYYSYSLPGFLRLYQSIEETRFDYENVIHELQETQPKEEEAENSGYSTDVSIGQIERTENTSSKELNSI
ncbi:PIN domain-containing protein [Porphyromonas gingivalis]|uniref:PIN domain-containing protein n=1 Tax=Porphyromonas gingivalis TaxID=837 RepID=UPI001B8A9E48|nr:PIN domain-containing protein [Porphyromonas gingivalis]MCE8183087.1 DUF4935 domain-containing protein [Porphyromonas gingivalis]